MPELLEDDIRATAPQPTPHFLAQLDKQVETGFAHVPVSPQAMKRKQRRRSWMSGLVPAMACALIALVVVGAALRSGGDDSDESGGSGGGDAAMSAPAERLRDASPESAAGSAAPEPAPVPPSPQQDSAARGIAPGQASRKKEVSTAVELSTPADEFSETTAGVLRVADATGTIVQSSSVSESNGTDRAIYDLRVPTSKLDAVMRELSELGNVENRTEDVQDITGAYVSARDRLADARDVRRALLKALERADSERERGAIRTRLGDARRQISAAEAEVRRVEARADRAKVAVTVRSTEESGAWMPSDAFDDAVRILEVIAGVALVALAILVPLGLVAGAGVGAARLSRRRKREAALG